jgi:hypothetical protein
MRGVPKVSAEKERLNGGTERGLNPLVHKVMLCLQMTYEGGVSDGHDYRGFADGTATITSEGPVAIG